MSKSPSDLTRPPDLSHERRTGPLRTQRPVYVDLLPPCNHACPAGENIQAWLGAGAGRALRGRLADPGRRQPDAGGARPRLLSPVRGQLQPQAPRQRGQHPRRRALPRRSRDREGLAVRTRDREALRQARLGGGRGPSGLSAAYHLARLGHAVEIRDAGPHAGRHDALRHPRLSHAARACSRPRSARSRSWA